MSAGQLYSGRKTGVIVPPVHEGLLRHRCSCGGAAGFDDICANCRRVRLSRQPAVRIGAALDPPTGGDSASEAERGEVGSAGGGSTHHQTQGSPTATKPSALNAPYFINFSHVAPPAEVDHSQASPGPSGSSADRAGYTRVRLRRRLTAAWQVGSPRGTGAGRTVAVAVRSANVFFRIDPVEVFVSSNYAGGSCPYRITRQHEYQHVAGFLRIFREHRADMAEEANSIALPTVSVPTQVPADRVSDEQDRILEPVVAAINRVRSRLVQAMNDDRAEKDSAANYRRVYARCPRDEW